jgi:hypothetical protein
MITPKGITILELKASSRPLSNFNLMSSSFSYVLSDLKLDGFQGFTKLLCIPKAKMQ